MVILTEGGATFFGCGIVFDERDMTEDLFTKKIKFLIQMRSFNLYGEIY